MKYPKSKPVWLVWQLRPDLNHILRAVDTTECMAVRHKVYLEGGERIRCYVEMTLTNHAYAASMRGNLEAYHTAGGRSK